MTRVFAELTDDPAEILGTFKSLGNDVDPIGTWLYMQFAAVSHIELSVPEVVLPHLSDLAEPAE